MMNHPACWLLTALAAVSLAQAQVTEPTAAVIEAGPPSLTVTVAPAVATEYMFRGQRRGGFSIQPDVEVGWGSAVAGVWGNFPLTGKVAGVSDPELDLYGSKALVLSEAASVVAGFTCYVYPRAGTTAGLHRATLEPSLALNYTLRGVKFTPKAYYDVTLRASTYELGAAYALPLQRWGTELDLSALAGTYLVRDAVNPANSPAGAWGNYWMAGAAVPFQVSRESKVILGFSYTQGRDSFFKPRGLAKTPNPAATGRVVVTLGYLWTF